MSDFEIASNPSTTHPILSAIICTFNRAELLANVLQSLCEQTLSPQDFEVVVIDDGSKDDTSEVAKSFSNKLPLRYIYQRNAGLAAAKNHGAFASRGDIVLFLDDDDIAAQKLLEEHVKTHRRYTAENFAALGYTDLSPQLISKPLMYFATEVGCLLFSYPAFKDGDILDYTHFWGGRSSCKRALLLRFGVFNPVFRFGCEDIELGYRLSKQGLRVVYNKNAVSTMIRDMDFNTFCRRLERQGNSNYVFSEMHPAPEIQLWTETVDAEQIWEDIGDFYSVLLKSARALDEIANLKLASGFELDSLTRDLLYRSYRGVFKACKVKGIIDKKKGLV